VIQFVSLVTPYLIALWLLAVILMLDACLTYALRRMCMDFRLIGLISIWWLVVSFEIPRLNCPTKSSGRGRAF
jgi:hypothetical protein